MQQDLTIYVNGQVVLIRNIYSDSVHTEFKPKSTFKDKTKNDDYLQSFLDLVSSHPNFFVFTLIFILEYLIF